MLLHSLFQRTIDYLKIDIEYMEWEVLESLLRNDVLKKIKQIGFEIHTKDRIHFAATYSRTKDYLYYYNILSELEHKGFKRWYSHANPCGNHKSPNTLERRTCCYELVLVNTNFTKNDFTEINKLIGRKIIPEFHKYQESQNTILNSSIKNTIRFAVGVGSAYVGFVPALSQTLISLLSGISPVLTETTLQLSDKLRDKKKRKYENTFSYFLNLNKG